MTSCPKCGAGVLAEALVCQRGHRLEEKYHGTTRAQDDAIERLALKHGRTHVKTGFADKKVRVTVPGGQHFHVHEDGRIVHKGFDHSVNWRS